MLYMYEKLIVFIHRASLRNLIYLFTLLPFYF